MTTDRRALPRHDRRSLGVLAALALGAATSACSAAPSSSSSTSPSTPPPPSMAASAVSSVVSPPIVTVEPSSPFVVAGSTVAGPSTSTAPAPQRETTPPEPASAAPPATVGVPRYAFPIAMAKASYGRTHHDYPAADIFASCGSAVVAATDGIVDEISVTDRWTKRVNDPTTRGGLFVSIRGDDAVRYYAAHLRSVDPSIVAGVRVVAGQLLGQVGRSGDASACHVHFGVSPVCGTGEWWVRRGVLWPAAFLDAWKKGVAASPAGDVAAWSSAHPTACTDPTSMPWPSR